MCSVFQLELVRLGPPREGGLYQNLEQVLEVLSVFLSQFLSSLHRAPPQIRAESTRARTEASARRSHTRLRSNAPAWRDSPGRSVSTVRSNLPHRSSEDFNLLTLQDQ